MKILVDKLPEKKENCIMYKVKCVEGECVGVSKCPYLQEINISDVKTDEDKYIEAVAEVIESVGIVPGQSAHQYLQDLLIYLKDNNVNSREKIMPIYKIISEKYDNCISSVERAIRYKFSMITKTPKFKAIFGNETPTVKEFVFKLYQLAMEKYREATL